MVEASLCTGDVTASDDLNPKQKTKKEIFYSIDEMHHDDQV